MAIATTLINVQTRTLHYKVFLGDLTMTGTGEYVAGGIPIPQEILDALRSLYNVVNFVYGENGDYRMYLDVQANTLIVVNQGVVPYAEIAGLADLPAGTWTCWFFSNKSLSPQLPPIA